MVKSAVLSIDGKSFRWRVAKLTSGVPRAAMLALIFMALGIISLRATCAVAFAGHSHGAVLTFMMPAGHLAAGPLDRGGVPPASCCDRVEDASIVKPADMLGSWTRGAPLGIVYFAFAGMMFLASRRVPQVTRPALTALPGRSYYARSARVLR